MLTTLVSVSPIYASFDTDEQVVVKALGSLPGGSSARTLLGRIPVRMGTSAGDDTPIEGRLQLIDNQVDARSGTIRVRATFDNKDGTLIPGQFARIRMGQAQATRALLVNDRAVGTDQNKKFVWVVGPENKAEYREVTLGATAEGLRVVKSGLKPGERIVVNGLQRVRPGVVLQPQVVEMNARASTAAKPAQS
jgi:multidrug efflux system membrane fusion protein